jgi:hypothetical protein
VQRGNQFHWNEEYTDWKRNIENKSCQLCRKGTNVCKRRGIPGHLNPVVSCVAANNSQMETGSENGVEDEEDGVEDEEDGVEDDGLEDEAEVLEACFVPTDADTADAAAALTSIVQANNAETACTVPEKTSEANEETDSLRRIQEACRMILG